MAGDEVPYDGPPIERKYINLAEQRTFRQMMDANGMPYKRSRLGEMMAGVMTQATHDAEFNSMFGLPSDIVAGPGMD